ncbi:hypothetical protein JDV02_002756 [Purpureocillium takamizusanense]|uniref:Heterokaryon incompatibility domain-containing protein n=1 Tax=Purpureocillium takamizusanense TaxID=2060973 RepID=A0A9Q8QB09_9HYPO|nr:uncharacterized protein JDV02_002756 [Purpureocillium takamizusanense]UNI16315.1 hypothetical protein JDV02_002756 [Purpureocillium takamizusanense]
MDLFCLPEDPAAPTPACPYVCVEHWDGGPFRSYAVRKSRAGLVPVSLRDTPGAEVATDVLYSENLYPTPQAELEPFLQTWLFFGLVAEVLGLNETASGTRLVDEETARTEIAELYDVVLVRDGQDVQDADDDNNTRGGKYITGVVLLQEEAGELFHQRLDLAPDKMARLVDLSDSLRYAVVTLHSIQENVRDAVRHSIVALGEMLTTGIFMAASLSRPPTPLPTVVGLNWFRDYVRAGGAVEAGMLARGWCPSEVDKVRAQFQGAFTMHYASRLRRRAVGQGQDSSSSSSSSSGHDHGGCSEHACKAFQMDLGTYRPSHAQEGCGCAHIEVCEADIVRVLRETDSFPVLRLTRHVGDGHGHGDGGQGQLRLSVEPWTSGVPYVAYSHVWADGLGNPRLNSLPRCQVERISRLVAALEQDVRESLSSSSPSADDSAGIRDSSSASANAQPYRIWIDTFCCPIELNGKLLALQRIADVYRNATHVLVLDKALAAFPSVGVHPAELLLRTIGASPWMRRLWTLQEGALAQSLFVQFADRAVNFLALLQDLFIIGRTDARYMRIWQDVMSEFNQLQSLSPKRDSAGAVLFNKSPTDLVHLQRALHFRTVSVAADEPLCIATLMDLDTRRIAEPTSHQDRMARVWEQLARLPATGDDDGNSGGGGGGGGGGTAGIPVRLLFFLEEPLDVPGWRWAPRTLLGSSVRDPVLGIDERVVRFVREKDGDPDALGTPTPLGLRVRLRGCRLVPCPRAPGLPLDPWPELIHRYEDQVLLQRDDDGGSGSGGRRWVRIMDWYRSRKLGRWTREQRVEHDTRVGQPLQRAIATGRCAIVYDPQASPLLNQEVCTCCLVQADELDDADLAALDLPTTMITSTSKTAPMHHVGADPSPPPLKARRERAILMSPLSDAEAHMMDVLQGVADRAAAHPATRELVALGPPPLAQPSKCSSTSENKGDNTKAKAKDGDGDTGNDKDKVVNRQKGDEGSTAEGEDPDDGGSPWEAASRRVRDLLKALVAEALAEHPEVVQTARDYIGPDLDEYLWVLVPKVLSHATFMRETPDGQVWYID